MGILCRMIVCVLIHACADLLLCPQPPPAGEGISSCREKEVGRRVAVRKGGKGAC